MLKSMTGFGSAESYIAPFGKVVCEARSINHRFLETLFHLPEGFSHLEERLKREIDKKCLRGRITLVLKFSALPKQKARIDTKVLKGYYSALEKIRRGLHLKEPAELCPLLSLPGVLGLEEAINKNHLWPKIKSLVEDALSNLLDIRIKEGRALMRDLRKHTQRLQAISEGVAARFKKIIREKASRIENLEERTAFLKGTDITEEVVRVRFHLKNFARTLNKGRAVGKELDFIAQELQRETNTIGAKSIDAAISGNVVTMKSEIEKIREQLQNVE